jgi:hypothetical protein
MTDIARRGLQISWTTEATDGEAGVFDADGLGPITIVTEHSLGFDCITAETHEGTSVLTEHAVEDGSPIADHKRANPRKLTIEAIVTNTPLDAPPPSGYGASGITAQIQASTVRIANPDGSNGTRNVKANVIQFSATFDRMVDVAATLSRLRLEATPVTITTRIRTYDALQVVSVTEPRKAEDGDSITFTIECQEVRIATSRTIDTPRPREPRGRPTTDRGAQEATQAPLSSALSRVRDDPEGVLHGLGSLVGAT